MRRVVLPDGVVVEVSSDEDYQRLVRKYEEEGYEILEQGDVVIITTKPKQASSSLSFSSEEEEGFIIRVKYGEKEGEEVCETVDENFIRSFPLDELVKQLCKVFENIYKDVFA